MEENTQDESNAAIQDVQSINDGIYGCCATKQTQCMSIISRFDDT